MRETSRGGGGVRRFLLAYLVLMGGFFVLISYEPVKRFIDINGLYTNAVVDVTARLLGIMGISAGIQGSIIQLPTIALDIRFGCNGLEAVLIYAVAVIAFPAAWSKKLAGIVGGFVVIQVLNIFRIAGLAYAGVYHRQLFDTLHVYVAQGIMIAVALGIFIVYLNYAGRGPEPAA